MYYQIQKGYKHAALGQPGGHDIGLESWKSFVTSLRRQSQAVNLAWMPVIMLQVTLVGLSQFSAAASRVPSDFPKRAPSTGTVCVRYLCVRYLLAGKNMRQGSATRFLVLTGNSAS